MGKEGQQIQRETEMLRCQCQRSSPSFLAELQGETLETAGWALGRPSQLNLVTPFPGHDLERLQASGSPAFSFSISGLGK